MGFLLDTYLAHCERRGFSDATRRCYRILVGQWLDYLDDLGIDDAGPAEVESFLDQWPDLGTRSSYLSWLRAFCRWAHGEGLMERDPTAKIYSPLLPRALPRPISEADLRIALDAADPRMRTWLLLAAKAGLRCKEIAGIRGQDLHLEREPVTLDVTNPKGRRERTVPLHPDILGALTNQNLDTGYLWPGQFGSHINAGTVSTKIGKHLRACGIDATAHQLRHRFGSQVYALTKDLRLTQELLGHASPATTQIYAAVDVNRAAEFFGDL